MRETLKNIIEWFKQIDLSEIPTDITDTLFYILLVSTLICAIVLLVSGTIALTSLEGGMGLLAFAGVGCSMIFYWCLTTFMGNMDHIQKDKK